MNTLEEIDFEELWIHCRDDKRVDVVKIANFIYYHYDCGPINEAKVKSRTLAHKAILVYRELGYIVDVTIHPTGHRETVWQI